MIQFRLDGRSGVAPYLQLVHQVRHAVRLGILGTGDQLPTVKEVAAQVAINPNTVLKAYRELEREGLVAPRPGAGTFVRRGLGSASPETRDRLFGELRSWMERARDSGLDEDDILALFAGAKDAPITRRA